MSSLLPVVTGFKCVDCDAMLVKQSAWNVADVNVRRRWAEGGYRKSATRRRCQTCYRRDKRARMPKRERIRVPRWCQMCERRLVPQRTWNAAGPAAKQWLLEQGFTKQHTAHLCSPCYLTAYRHGTLERIA